jgi:hypothetical protein
MESIGPRLIDEMWSCEGGRAVRRYGGRAVRGMVSKLGLAVTVGLLTLLPLSTKIVAAQNLPPYRRTAVPPPDSGSELTVYLMTMGPGKHVWERFGHNAIWIHDPVRGTDQAYNYGIFSFKQQNFLLRFVQGRMWYMMQGAPAALYLEEYRRNNRSVWVQELNIPAEARRELQAFLEWNERPENRFYHYDYYRDNCSTRVRDALDKALNGQIRSGTARTLTTRTYRFHTLRLTANDLPIYTGLLLALGRPVDRPISEWEEMFLPLAMREHLRKLRVTSPDGRVVPLVRSERTLFESTEPTPPARPPSWLWRYLLAGLLIGGLAYGSAQATPNSRLARAGFLTISWTWVLITGAAGLILAGMWGLTDHAAAYHNENVLQTDLLVLPLLWFVPRLTWGSRSAARPALVLAMAVAALSLLGLLLKLLPQFYQVNGAIIALALPAHAGVAAGIWRLARMQDQRTRRTPSRASG